MLILFVSITTIIIMAIFICMAASYFTHIHMNKKQCCPYDFVKFETFIKEYNKYRNDPELEHGFDNESIFLRKITDATYNEILYLHASIVKINGKCMIFYPIDWFKYCIWMRQFKKQDIYRVKGLWDVNE